MRPSVPVEHRWTRQPLLTWTLVKPALPQTYTTHNSHIKCTTCHIESWQPLSARNHNPTSC